jgi:hypothetical protein
MRLDLASCGSSTGRAITTPSSATCDKEVENIALWIADTLAAATLQQVSTPKKANTLVNSADSEP